MTTKEIAALPERNPDLQNTLLPTSPTEAEEAERLIQNWLAEAGADEGEEEKQASEERNPLKLGVLLAPQNISNSNQNINFGAGLMSEISFSKRLKLDVGVGYAKQNLTPESASRGGQFMADIGSADGQKAYMMSSNYIRSSSELSFGQIEIPLNMKYSFVQKKTADFYLVSGVSNMFYINQEKTVTFNTVSFAAQGMNASPQMVGSATVTEAPSGSQNQVDVGQLINFGLGFEHHLKNGTSLSFEPFYKFSVGDQTFVNQRFAIGGINLRMNFQLK